MTTQALEKAVHDFVRRDFAPNYGKLDGAFRSDALWARLRALGTRLWLDTGSLEESGQLWTREFSALTTNNTLLSKEVIKGQYDDLVRAACRMLEPFRLPEAERMLELAFILNAKHGLRLVERYDALVSVEEHTNLANDVEAAVRYAHRYHAVCPERFIVKIPLTPAGLLATRRIAAAGVPVNHTLGFSARQNYVVARLARPAYVNVFLGRLNALVADNKLGDGTLVGEKAAWASQNCLHELRRTHKVPTLQIGASLRSGRQVAALAGMDVLTMPPKAAAEFLALNLAPRDVHSKSSDRFEPLFAQGVDAARAGLNTLWDVNPKVVACVDALERQGIPDSLTPDGLIDFFATHGCGDLFVKWSPDMVAVSRKEGKIPAHANWRPGIEKGTIGLDALMNLAGLNSFVADQEEMDRHVAKAAGA